MRLDPDSHDGDSGPRPKCETVARSVRDGGDPESVRHLLDDSRLMAARAMDQFETLRCEVNSFSSRNASSAVVRYDATANEHVVKIPSPLEMPTSWGLHVGEMVSNSVSALNYVVRVLVRAAGAEPHHDNAFPIAETTERYYKPGRGGVTFRDRRLKGIPEYVRIKFDDLQPFHRHNNAYLDRLAVLQTLRDAAEHHELQAASLSLETPTHIVRVPTRSPYSDLEVRVKPNGDFSAQAEFTYQHEDFGIMVGPRQVFGNRVALEPVFGSNLARLVTVEQLGDAVRWSGSIVDWFRSDVDALLEARSSASE